jgi:hypothetical protein
VHHVFQAVAALLDEGDAALRRASAFLSQHLQAPDPLNHPDDAIPPHPSVASVVHVGKPSES